ncbi:hypothetical protein NG42_08365 [Winslowiella iniecta]|uniref:Uncharacterized protein n=1 Tax=Winslowiella iniecta TaxID=1560201 RepID=A0A0L7TCQ9_9GAMM|nr:hypothetical protein NG42_08365 [Winslowiella iniecta]KOC93148.1 hypothetical protein NG43_12220 [Winslowiella iniecta]
MTEPLSADLVALLAGKTSLAALCGISPQQLDELYARGYQAWEEGNLDTATHFFAFVAQFDPAARRNIFAYACALKQQGEYVHALRLFSHAVQMQPSDPFAPFHLANCLEAIGEVEGAREVLNATISLCFDAANSDVRYEDLRRQAEDRLTELNG